MSKYYGYLGKGDDRGLSVSIKKGQVLAGYTIGILLLDTWYPLVPGNVQNVCTFDYPVRHKLVPGATQIRMHKGDPTLFDDLVKASRELIDRDGVRAIVGACGYFGNFQPQLAAALEVPVFLSSLIQIPWIKTGLKPNQKVGVLCADEPSLTPEILKKVGVEDPSICVVKGIGDEPEFSAILNSDRGRFNADGVRNEVINATVKLVEDNPDIGAILLECSDMPPYSAEVQRAVNLPVYDFITMINWVHQSVAQRHYYGYL